MQLIVIGAGGITRDLLRGLSEAWQVTVVDNDQERLDLLRDPNPHVAFGGHGAHYCIGANLARLEIDLIFNAIADAMPSIRKSGDAERLRSGWLNGIKRLPVSYS